MDGPDAPPPSSLNTPLRVSAITGSTLKLTMFVDQCCCKNASVTSFPCDGTSFVAFPSDKFAPMLWRICIYIYIYIFFLINFNCKSYAMYSYEFYIKERDDSLYM